MPKVFISYSWDNEEHKKWTLSFADKLLENGIEAYIDQYDVQYGDRLPHFMEEYITKANFVLIVCTPQYKEKADSRQGGVGYEGNIISGELFAKGNERKFIPIIRRGNEKSSMPSYLAGKYYVDLRDGSNFETQFKDLITTLKGQHKKPPAKRLVSDSKEPIPIQKTTTPNEPVRILGIITDQVTVPKMNGTRGSALYKIPFRSSKKPSKLWKELFVRIWNHPPQWTAMHRSGIASVYEDEIILDGTTIEEVRNYHRETLILCVDEANKTEKKYLEEEQHQRELEETCKDKHYNKISDIADDIKF